MNAPPGVGLGDGVGVAKDETRGWGPVYVVDRVKDERKGGGVDESRR